MTDEEIAQRMEYVRKVLLDWQDRLKLAHWEIEFRGTGEIGEVDWEAHGDAFVQRARDYNEAKLYVCPKFFEWSDEKTNQVIVHELLHTATREVEYILSAIEEMLHRDVERVISDTHRHHVEGAIDFLAYRFVEIGGALRDNSKGASKVASSSRS